MSANCGVSAIFHIYDQFGAIWKEHSGHMVCNNYIFINRNANIFIVNLLSYKNWKQD